jgi:hypothetical protein
MTARVHWLLRGSLGATLATLGCSFNAAGLGEGEPGATAGTTTDVGSGGPGSGAQTSGGPPPTTSEGAEASGSGDGATGSTSDPVDPTTGVDPSTTTGVDPSTTTGVDPSTTTGVDPSTTTMGCVEQSYFKDGDKDGYGDPNAVKVGCEAPDGYVDDDTDCDDGNDKANPGAAEVCGGGDNDCDGLVDEYSPGTNVDCGGCKMFPRDATLYHFCGMGKNWDDAKVACEGRKAVLAKDGDQATHDWLMARLTEIGAGGGSWWLGGRTPDGNHANYEWRDGTKFGAFQPWAGFNPSGLDNTDCMRVASPATALIAGQWTDWYCTDKRPFICQGPLP